MMSDELPDWTTDEYLANLAADELAKAINRHGIQFHGVMGDSDGTVGISFPDLRDAEALLTLTLSGTDHPGGIYDRATGSCVLLTDLASKGDDASDDEISRALGEGWNWMIHPHMIGRRMGWHVSVDIPTADANALTAALNTLANVGTA
jgi:class 3 adenylate cyclase